MKRFSIKLVPVEVLAVSGFLVVVALQYFPLQYGLLKSGVGLYWTISDEYLADLQVTRYIKDLYLVVLCAVWAGLALLKKSYSTNLFHCIVYVFGMVLYGLVNQVADFNSAIAIAGLRWVLLLLGAMSIFHMLQNIADSSLQRVSITLSFLNAIIFMILLLSFSMAVWQWSVMGYPSLAGLRINGMYANAGVFGFALAGYSLWFMYHTPKSKSQLGVVFLLILGCALLSGSRTALLISSIALIGALSSFVKLSIDSKWVAAFSVIIFGCFLYGAYNLLAAIDAVVGRGSLLEAQLEVGRIKIMIAFLDRFTSDIGIMLFGNGLGYGTNTAILLDKKSVSDISDVIVDSTVLTFIGQFGLVGAIVLVVAFVKLCVGGQELQSYKIKNKILLVSFIIAALSQNVFENYVFMPILALLLALFVLKSKRSTHV